MRKCSVYVTRIFSFNKNGAECLWYDSRCWHFAVMPLSICTNQHGRPISPEKLISYFDTDHSRPGRGQIETTALALTGHAWLLWVHRSCSSGAHLSPRAKWRFRFCSRRWTSRVQWGVSRTSVCCCTQTRDRPEQEARLLVKVQRRRCWKRCK